MAQVLLQNHLCHKLCRELVTLPSSSTSPPVLSTHSPMAGLWLLARTSGLSRPSRPTFAISRIRRLAFRGFRFLSRVSWSRLPPSAIRLPLATCCSLPAPGTYGSSLLTVDRRLLTGHCSLFTDLCPSQSLIYFLHRSSFILYFALTHNATCTKILLCQCTAAAHAPIFPLQQ